MKILPLFLAASVLPAFAAGANAQVLSGGYALVMERICQVITASDGTVTDPGNTRNIVGTAVFDPNAGTMALNATEIDGVLIASPTSGGVNQIPLSTTVAFSVTPSTLTIDVDTFNAVFHREIAGIVQRVIFNGIVSDDLSTGTCTALGSLEGLR